jgi:hypothetical protein
MALKLQCKWYIDIYYIIKGKYNDQDESHKPTFRPIYNLPSMHE